MGKGDSMEGDGDSMEEEARRGWGRWVLFICTLPFVSTFTGVQLHTSICTQNTQHMHHTKGTLSLMCVRVCTLILISFPAHDMYIPSLYMYTYICTRTFPMPKDLQRRVGVCVVCVR